MNEKLTSKQNKLIEQNMVLIDTVLRTTHRYYRPYMKDEIESHLHFILCNCALKFNPDVNCSFAAYASKAMTWAVLNCARKEYQHGMSYKNSISTDELKKNCFSYDENELFNQQVHDIEFSNGKLDFEKSLTDQEQPVLYLLIAGFSLKEIAIHLDLSVATISRRNKKIKSKMKTAFGLIEPSKNLKAVNA